MGCQQSGDDLISLAVTIRTELERKLSNKARVHLPFDEDKTEFEKANLRFTQYERPTYLAIVDPVCENDVIEVVKYAREKGIPFTPRGGHHSVTTTMGRMEVNDVRPETVTGRLPEWHVYQHASAQPDAMGCRETPCHYWWWSDN